MTWTCVSPDEAEVTWDAELSQFTGDSLYQSWAWGRYKVTRGWSPRYFRGVANGKVVAMLQGLVRMYPLRTVVAWCPGGPVGDLDACAPASMTQLLKVMGGRALYCRSSFLRVNAVQDEEYLQANGWTRPRTAVGAGLTSVWDLTQSEEQLLAGLNRNWRYSLRQALKGSLVIDHLSDPSIDELSDLCRAMNASKGIAAATRTSDVKALFEALGERAVVYGCRNESGELIAFHSCGIHGRRAWELIAATSEEGRKKGASFAALWALVLHCRRLQITQYDLAGVDPVKAQGVAAFKRWTGAQDIEWLGEWEWSSSSLLRHAVGVAARHREGTALP